MTSLGVALSLSGKNVLVKQLRHLVTGTFKSLELTPQPYHDVVRNVRAS